MPATISLNGVLAALPAGDLERLQPDLEPVELPLRHRLAEAGKPISTIYFLTAGIASTVASNKRDAPIEIGVTGREGYVGLPVILGANRSPNETYMQVAGQGWLIPAKRLRAAMSDNGAIAAALYKFVHAFMAQATSSVLANGRATLYARLARWLLMAHDRMEGDELPVTHEFLALMLGVRRAGVTNALLELERRALVARQRGVVVVLDRAGLQEAANGYYGSAEDEYHRLFGRPLRRA